MPNELVFTIRFLQPYSHGRGDGGEPEWPLSPLRLFQALVAAAAAYWNERTALEYAVPALRWLEHDFTPEIVAPEGLRSENPYRLYVPDNLGDKVAKAWLRGGSASIADYRTDKDVRPMHLIGESLHYLFTLPDGTCPHLEVLKAAARSITHLGWGVDMVAADADVISEEEAAKLPGHRWRVVPAGGTPLRVPKAGTLDDLIRKHADFLNRVTQDGFRPVPPLREFEVVRYRSQHETLRWPVRLFELRNLDGSRFRYPHRRFVHIAGMVRHLAIEAMKKDPPRGVVDSWVETYVAGHKPNDSQEHRQLSYLPLPSIGHAHVDPGIRRVMIAAPVGDDVWLEHVARRLAGQQLKAMNQKTPEFGVEDDGRPNPGPILVPLPLKGDGVTRAYTNSSSIWHSFTPIILPGHDDHKPEKTRRLIVKALAQSGIDQPCEFEWGAFSHFPKSYSAHKYVRDEQTHDGKRPVGYIRPDHLLSQTAVHLKLRFNDDLNVPGPLTVGAGRHCGFGLMAACES
jgi:CRISPR-associated protein Csb2